MFKVFLSYNDDFKQIADVFSSSLKDSCDLIVLKTDNFKRKWKIGGGIEGVQGRKKLIDYAFEKTEKEEIFLICDADIKFYKPVLEQVIQEISQKQKTFDNGEFKYKDIDLLIQKEVVSKGCNMGFVAMRNNYKVKSFWNDVLVTSIQKNIWEQAVLNTILYNNTFFGDGFFAYRNNLMNWARFSNIFWNWSMGSTGIEFDHNSCLHHANCSVTIENKINQFNYVEQCYKNKTKIDYSKSWKNNETFN